MKIVGFLFAVCFSSACFAQGLAEHKNNIQASSGYTRHVGGGFGGGRYEGVGFSTSSPEHALRKCCFYGQRPILEQSVKYGYHKGYRTWGWFATIIYK